VSLGAKEFDHRISKNIETSVDGEQHNPTEERNVLDQDDNPHCEWPNMPPFIFPIKTIERMIANTKLETAAINVSAA